MGRKAPPLPLGLCFTCGATTAAALSGCALESSCSRSISIPEGPIGGSVRPPAVAASSRAQARARPTSSPSATSGAALASKAEATFGVDDRAADVHVDDALARCRGVEACVRPAPLRRPCRGRRRPRTGRRRRTSSPDPTAAAGPRRRRRSPRHHCPSRRRCRRRTPRRRAALDHRRHRCLRH